MHYNAFYQKTAIFHIYSTFEPLVNSSKSMDICCRHRHDNSRWNFTSFFIPSPYALFLSFQFKAAWQSVPCQKDRKELRPSAVCSQFRGFRQQSELNSVRGRTLATLAPVCMYSVVLFQYSTIKLLT